jgi:hypothetical protein
LERPSSEQKLALRAVLSYYLFYKLKVESDYAASDAIIDAMLSYTQVSLDKIISTHEGIESENAQAQLKFLTAQRNYQAAVLGEVVSHSTPDATHSQRPAVVERLATLQNQLQQISRNHQTELDTLLQQVQINFVAVSRELKSIISVMLSLHGHGSSALIEAAPRGQQV